MAVSDMEAAIAFYRDVFQCEPTRLMEQLVYFEVAGGRFGLFEEAAYSDEFPVQHGNSTVVTIQVDDILAQFERIRSLNPRAMDDSLSAMGRYRGFTFTDHDGNVTELLQLS
jgi:predicted enzyme related to lactoylglutathione lyase